MCLYVYTHIYQRGLCEHTAQGPAHVGNAINLGSAGTHEDISHAEKRPSRKNKQLSQFARQKGRFPAAMVENYHHHTLGTRLSSGTHLAREERKIRARPGVQTLSVGTVEKSVLYTTWSLWIESCHGNTCIKKKHSQILMQSCLQN